MKIEYTNDNREIKYAYKIYTEGYVIYQGSNNWVYLIQENKYMQVSDEVFDYLVHDEFNLNYRNHRNLVKEAPILTNSLNEENKNRDNDSYILVNEITPETVFFDDYTKTLQKEFYNDFLNTLSDRDKQIIEYYYKENVSIYKIADKINSYVTTVSNAKGRAINKAKKLYNEKYRDIIEGNDLER